MTAESDQMEWSVESIDPILLNALVDRQREGVTALANDESRELVGEAFDTTVDDELEAKFESAAETVQSESDSLHSEGQDAIETVVTKVRDALADQGVVATVTHEKSMELDTDKAVIYTFSRSRNPAALTRLDVADDVAEPLRDAVDHIDGEQWEAAAETLDDAVAAAMTIREEVITRTLAALCYHWSGDDQRAIDLVGESVSLDSNTWLPWLPGYSADADPEYATTDEFRADKYAVSAFLRYIAESPEGASVTPYVGYTDDGDMNWEEFDSTPICIPLARLDEETFLRFNIEGPVDAFPAFQAYYIGLGIVDLEVNEIRDVLKVLEDGPTGDRVTESVRFEKPDG
ncbi:hypothetical protein ABNG03_05315 [Halorubrum sp. RMP-47]|uniref:hypothetical protein n=1 Tax=Halorubrum miltondacostae TaxID=3076378 RepID=UPI0035296A57